MRITLPSGTPAELSRPAPADGEPRPAAPRGLVVIPDMMGLRPLFDEHVRRLAERTGWPVCAFEVWPGAEDRPVDWRLAHMGERDDAVTLRDAVDAADVLGAERVGILGFCMGGMYTLKAAATGRFSRAAAFYGMIRLPEEWRGPGQAEPLEVLRGPDRCPTMAIIGTADPYTPPEDVEALAALGVEVVRYDGAEHGFVHDPDRPAHRAEDAADAWTRVLGFLAT